MNIIINDKSIKINQVGIVGWAGRDKASVQAHIDELKAIGVKPPSKVPLVYHVTPYVVTQRAHIDFVGTHHSGEAEVCLIADENQQLWVGLGSDHTDRQLEAHDVAFSKQVCAKPLAKTAWRYDDVIAHWDELILSSQIKPEQNTSLELYQQGKIDSLLHITDIIAELPSILTDSGGIKAHTLLLCGTLPTIGGVNCRATEFTMTLEDPVLKRAISHTYRIGCLPHNG